MKYEFSKAVENLAPSGIRAFFDLVMNSDGDVISLGVGEPDFATPWNIREEAIYALERGMTSYTSNMGLSELRRHISEYLKKIFKYSYDRHTEILITNGVSEGVDIVFRSLLNPGDEVILPEPVYVCYRPLIELCGAKVVSIDTSLSDFIPDPKAIANAITKKTKAIVLCSPSNPTGAVIPQSVLNQIADLSKKHGFWVLSDEIYAELTYEDNYPKIANLPGMKDHTIVLNGFSKAFAMTGFRLGYICAPKALIERANKIHQYAALCAPILSQVAGVEALKGGRTELDVMKRSYLARRNWFVKQLNKIGLPTVLPSGAFYCFPSIKETGLSSEEFALQLFKSNSVAVVPGSVFGAGGEGFVRCCYASSMDDLKEAVVRIEDFLKKRK